MTKEFLTVREVAERSGLSRSYIYRAVEAGSLPCYKPSRRRVLIRWSEFEQWLAQFQQRGTVNGSDWKPARAPSPRPNDLLPFSRASATSDDGERR